MLMIAALLSGCSPTSPGISNQPTPNNQIYIVGGAQVKSPSNTGKAPYTVFCALQYADTSMNNRDFNSANVTVNGVALVRVYQNGYFENIGRTMGFSEGDSLEFVIKHQKTGTVRKVVYVPPSVTDLSVFPGLSIANLPNSDISFDLSWTPVTASYYLVEALGYNYWETMLVADSTFATLSESATVALKDSSGSACPYVYFRVQSFNAVPLEGFAAGSGFGVSGAYFNANSNMPNASSNVRLGVIREK
jgi:hypothetical protein